VLGRTFANDGLPVTVLGVLPAGFRFLSSTAQFFRPMAQAPGMRSPAARHASSGVTIARLAPGASLSLAQTQLDALDARLSPEDPQRSQWTRWGYHTVVNSLHADHVREVRPVLLLVQAGAVFLWLIGLVNLANLLLVRANARSREIAVRRALGASRRQVATHAMLEIVLIVVVAGALGLALAAVGVRGVTLLGVDRLPLGATVSLDVQTVVIGLAAAILSGGMLAVPVLWFMLRTRPDPGAELRTRGETADRTVHRMRRGFVVVQVALTFMLLAGSGLLGLSLRRLLQTPLGFNPSNVISGQVALPTKSFADHASQAAFVSRLLPVLQGLPGVTQVAICNGMPFTGRVAGGVVSVENPGRPADRLHYAHYRIGVTSDYWSAMGIPLLRGRLLGAADEQRTEHVCVIDQSLADRYWPGGDPIGRRLSFGDEFDAKTAVTVVGIVGNVKQKSLTEDPGFGAVYFPFSKFSTRFFSVIVRGAEPAEGMAISLRKAVLAIDPELPVYDLQTLQTRVDDSLVAHRSPAILAAMFAGVALILAAVGTYGVLSYTVAQQRHEIGVRMALGAEPGRIGRQFIGLGVRMLLAGLALGISGAIISAKAMAAVLYGVPGVYWPVLGSTAAILATISLLASWLPARRAARVDPMVVLRCE